MTCHIKLVVSNFSSSYQCEPLIIDQGHCFWILVYSDTITPSVVWENNRGVRDLVSALDRDLKMESCHGSNASEETKIEEVQNRTFVIPPRYGHYQVLK